MVGADAALLKPCDFGELRSTIRDLTSPTRGGNAASAK
jgi:hypothetical protein